jgi:GNAT superfamily N-acetyltransferase
VKIRAAGPEDVATLDRLIGGLAEYEKLEKRATEAGLAEHLFGPRAYVEALLAFEEGPAGEEPVAFALFFRVYSTFRGTSAIYLEDLFVLPSQRSRGVGRALLAHLARLARERGCDRLEWAVLDWNEPAIRFYERLGARRREGWSVYGLEGGALKRLAATM